MEDLKPEGDTRAHIRVEVEFAAAKLTNESGGIYGELRNISEGGLAILTDKAIEEDTVVYASFALAATSMSPQMIRALCRARHSYPDIQGKGVITGLAFENLSPDDQAVIQVYIMNSNKQAAQS
jgi:c-di-GMP-binding flagellar brake protein YcgR